MLTQTDNQLNKEKTEKPQIKNNDCIEQYCKSNKREKKPILSLDDLLKAAQDIYKFGIKRTAYTVAKTTLGNGKAKSIKRFRYDPLLPQIIEYIMGTGGSCTSLTLFDNKYAFPNVSGRRLKRAVQKLVKLRWLLRTGRGGFAFYIIHPYLRVLVERWDDTMILAVYSGLKLSLEDCLNMPLFNALDCGKKITSIESKFREFPKRYYDIPKWLHGETFVSGKFGDGSEFNTLLWVNYHAGRKIIGKAEKGYKGKGLGKPAIDPEGNPHYTLPLKWALWGIKESIE
ncbi:hypothetical protein GX831_00685, partial [bacterium]|nr:hypothetical protein [bacterium]